MNIQLSVSYIYLCKVLYRIFLPGGELDSINMYSLLCFPSVLLSSFFGSGSLVVKSESVFVYNYTDV